MAVAWKVASFNKENDDSDDKNSGASLQIHIHLNCLTHKE
jgi:hypothetical protein